MQAVIDASYQALFGPGPVELLRRGLQTEHASDLLQRHLAHLDPVACALAGTRFRQAIAPVYLRRNQSDVLDELPPRLETEEWVELDGMAFVAYKEAVAEGNFMAMRRSAFAPGTPNESAKLRRLLEIVEEAAQDGRKVVVFSFFRDVLSIVTAAIGPAAIGPITGSVPAAQRQAMIDEFTARFGPAVLVAQIIAGGIGLNIQAASVVIICEPQWNPSGNSALMESRIKGIPNGFWFHAFPNIAFRGGEGGERRRGAIRLDGPLQAFASLPSVN